MRIDGNTASKLRWTKFTAPAPGPQYAVTPEDDELACMVEVPIGPMFGLGGGKVCANAGLATSRRRATPVIPAAWIRRRKGIEANFRG